MPIILPSSEEFKVNYHKIQNFYCKEISNACMKDEKDKNKTPNSYFNLKNYASTTQNPKYICLSLFSYIMNALSYFFNIFRENIFGA